MIPNNHKSPLVRVAFFMSLLLLISGLIGPKIIASPRLFVDTGFVIYPNIGKLILVFVFILGIIAHKQKLKLANPQWSWVNGLSLIGLLVSIFYYYRLVTIGARTSQLPQSFNLVFHVFTWLLGILLVLSTLGVQLVVSLIKKMWRWILLLLGVSPFVYLGIFQFWRLWPFFSKGVLYTVASLVSLLVPTQVIPPYTLIAGEFAVAIAQACSGLDSLFLFVVLYSLIAVLDSKRLHLKKVLWYFPVLAVGVYLVNILRVTLLVLIGVYISPQLSLQLFHTYAGMVLFILYFGIILKFVYPRMGKR